MLLGSHPHSNLEPLLALAEAAVGRKVGRLWRGKGVATNDEDQLCEIGKLTTCHGIPSGKLT